MTERDRRSEFLNFMRLPDGTPLATVEVLDYLTINGFFTAPASTKYHGNYEGGLFDHSLSVAKHLVGLTERFHDLCKIDLYRHPVKDTIYIGGEKQSIFDELSWEHNPNTLLKGHGDKSVMLLSQFYKLTEEEVLCIRYHMGAFTDKSEWNDYTRAVNLYPNVLWAHQADMLASHVEGV